MTNISPLNSQNSPLHTSSADAKDIKLTKGVKKGKETTRLKLSDDKAYYISAKNFNNRSNKIKDFITRLKYAKVKVGSKEILVNIHSLSKRLGISKKEARLLARNSDGFDQMKNLAERRKAELEIYHSSIEELKVTKGRRLKTKQGQKLGVNPKTLLKVIRKGLNIQKDPTIKMDNIKIGPHQFLVNKEGELSFISKKLGKGTFGGVFISYNMKKNSFEALKESVEHKKQMSISSKEQLENEATIHSKLREDKKPNAELPGIQSAPRTVTTITKNGIESSFYQTDLAAGDISPKSSSMKKFYNLRTIQKLDLCGQLVQGLKYCHDKDVVHGDIKPNNCLMKVSPSQYPEKFMLADFGLSWTTDGKAKLKTPYMPNNESSPWNIESGKKSDVFSLSLTLIEVLTGKYPFHDKSGKKCHPVAFTLDLKYNDDEIKELIKEIKQNLLKNDISIDLVNLLMSGLDAETHRPDATTFHQIYQNIIGEINPLLKSDSSG